MIMTGWRIVTLWGAQERQEKGVVDVWALDAGVEWKESLTVDLG